MQKTARRGPSGVLISSLALAVPFVAAGILAPEQLTQGSQATVDWITAKFDWLYLLVVFAFVIFCGFLAFSRYGDVRLGKPDDRPEFSTLAWLSMIISAGIGCGLLFFGMAEPIQHYLAPHGHTELGSTPEAASMAFETTFLHWGVHAWAVYGVTALVLAWNQFRHGRPGLISSAFYPLLGDRVKGPIGGAIDAMAVLATVFGVACTLGFSTSQLNSGLNHLFGVPVNNEIKLLIIVAFTVLYLLSATTGLQRGIKYLSMTNMALCGILFAAITLLGPTVEGFRAFTDGIGRYVQNFVQLSVGQSPFSSREWLHVWTVVIWTWWVSWAPFVGTFIARISKGRTIREFVTAVLLLPSLVAFLWFSSFGTTGIQLVKAGVPLVAAIEKDISSVLFVALGHIPGGEILSVVAMLSMGIFFITSADSAVYVLAMMTSRGDLNPPQWLRIVWGLVQSGIGATLLLAGGLEAVQIITIIAAFPFLFMLVGMCASLLVGLRAEERVPALESEASSRVAPPQPSEAVG